MTQAPKQKSTWIHPAATPQPLETSRFVLEPLAEKHAKLDFEALMSCRERLRAELQWGSWPPEDFTLELNRADLERHDGEFRRGEAFAYTVLHPDRLRCQGCLYLERCTEINGAQLAYWVIDDAIDLETELVTDVLQWVHREWSIRHVVLPFLAANSRGIATSLMCGLRAWADVEGGPLFRHRCFLSESALE